MLLPSGARPRVRGWRRPGSLEHKRRSRQVIEKPVPADSDEIVRLIERAGVFGPMDVECVRELLRDYFCLPDRGGYEFLIYRRDGHILGMACYGHTPLTEGTFDLYWLCVAPEGRRAGIGRTLMAEVEAAIHQAGGRLLVVETSGTPAYRPAREFYQASGFRRQATIPDFYSPGDDLVIYTKRFDT